MKLLINTAKHRARADLAVRPFTAESDGYKLRLLLLPPPLQLTTSGFSPSPSPSLPLPLPLPLPLAVSFSLDETDVTPPLLLTGL